MSATKRISKELTECAGSLPAGMTVTAADNNIFKWEVVLAAPAESVYAGGTYRLDLAMPTDYPFKPPSITFATRIYHPNVMNDSSGAICLGILKSENWKPSQKLVSVLEAVRALLLEPLPDDPLEVRIAEQYKNNRAEFDRTARQYVKDYAGGK